MAITINATWGAEGANSYITPDDATTFLASHTMNYDAWEQAKPELQKRALIVASRQIDSMNWNGSRYYVQQTLEWPRVASGETRPIGLFADPSSGAYLNLLIDDEYQQRAYERVRIACSLQALYLIQIESTSNLANPQRHRSMQQAGVRNFSVSVPGGASESYSYGSNRILSEEAWKYLSMYKAPRRIVRGDALSGERDRR